MSALFQINSCITVHLIVKHSLTAILHRVSQQRHKNKADFLELLFFSGSSRGCCSDWLKMSLMPLALLFVFLTSAEAQSSFSKIPDSYKKGVELALQNVNAHEGVQQHFLFFKTIQKSQIEAGFDVTYIYHNFYLKATTCQRGTENADTTTCAFRNDRPLIDCAICYKTYAGEIEAEPKPYVNCVHKPALTEDMQKERMDHCNKMGYSSGSPTLLAVKYP